MAYELLEEEFPQENFALKASKEGLRHGARTASNLATRGVGLPGDIFSLINQFIAKPITEKVTQQEGSPYEETIVGKLFPTTETHRGRLEEKTGEFLKPHNKIEKFADDVVEDTALFFNPSNLATKGIKTGKLLKNFYKSLGANFAGETVKQQGQNETAGNLTKFGSLIFLSLLDQESAAKQVGKLYNQAENNLPKGASEEAIVLNKNLNNLEQKVTRGRPTANLSAPEKFVIDQVGKVKNLIHDGKINIDQAWAQKRSLNKELSSLYKEVPARNEQKSVKDLSKQINGYINQTIEQYGKKNPKFYKPFKDADQAYGTLAKSNFISGWIENNVVQNPVTMGLLHLVGGGIGTTVASFAVPYQAAKLGYRIAKSPTLAKIYGNTVKAAVKEDAKLFNKYLKELDNHLQEIESEDQYEFID